MRYLVGGNKIKFRAIADFRVRFGKEIEEVFTHSVSLLCHKNPNIGMDIKADGTKIKANASDLRTHKKSEWETRKEVMKQAILDYLSSGINPDRKEDKLPGKKISGYEISSKEAEKYMKIKECLKRAEEFSLDSKINLTDDDGKFMLCKTKSVNFYAKLR